MRLLRRIGGAIKLSLNGAGGPLWMLPVARIMEYPGTGNVKNAIIYTNWNILKSIRKCGDAWRMTNQLDFWSPFEVSAFLPLLFIQAAQMKWPGLHHCHYHSHCSTSEDLMVMVLQPVCLPPKTIHPGGKSNKDTSTSKTIMMSMTNHGRTSKICPEIFPNVNSMRLGRLKLVPKYCYKCVESKQLETNWKILKWMPHERQRP